MSDRHGRWGVVPRFTLGQCPTGKRTFHTRADARRALRSPGMEGRHMRAYRCLDGCYGWHVGYLPREVLRGQATASEHYGRAG